MEIPKRSFIQYLGTSYEFALAIGNSLNLSEMLHEVIHTIVHKTNAHHGIFWVVDEEKELRPVASAGINTENIPTQDGIMDFQDVFNQILRRHQFVLRCKEDKDFLQYCSVLTEKEESVLIVPVGDVAILYLVYASRELADEPLAHLLTGLSKKLSVAIEACTVHKNVISEIQEREKTEEELKKKTDQLISSEKELQRLYGESEQARKSLLSILEDVTRKEEALRESEEKVRTLYDSSSDAIMLLDEKGFFDCNDATLQLFGCANRGEFYSRHPADFSPPTQPDGTDSMSYARNNIVFALKEGYKRFEYLHRRLDGTDFPAEVLLDSMVLGGKKVLQARVYDITERKLAEKEQEKLQAELIQAQKMESVGRLAGGVAHDFNNMLCVILGHTEMVLEQMDPTKPIHDHLTEISKAAEYSADLTKQLLAFARKQTITPRVLNLNYILESMLNLLQRLIGEDIDLSWLPGADLWTVNIDPSQIDQILANLCVNARDAIEDVGNVTIKTGNASLDEAYCADYPGLYPGEYVLLTVSDSGCGMDRETLDKIYEPFFTTKGIGKGTGLGLSTIYGIVKQNKGYIGAYSEPGQGTTFNIYLPRHTVKAEVIQMNDPAEQIRHGHETILLVEDEPAVMEMTKMMLERQGYSVLSASTPGEAIRLAVEHSGRIHLLMTDVVMPEMNGRDLARNLLSIYPDIKRLFMSGYTANVIAHHGVLNEGVHFIQKPFTKQNLSVRVRKVLDSE